MSDGAPNVGNWIGAGVTLGIAAVAAVWALVRRLLSCISREELVDILERIEDRHEATIRELRKTIMNLHEDNRDARHRLRDDLQTPLTMLTTEIVRLRESMERK